MKPPMIKKKLLCDTWLGKWDIRKQEKRQSGLENSLHSDKRSSSGRLRELGSVSTERNQCDNTDHSLVNVAHWALHAKWTEHT